MVEKKRSNLSKKVSVSILSIIILSAVIFYAGYTYGISYGSGLPSSIIESGSMVSGYSYTIFTDGVTYWAKNGTTGAIDYSGTSASTVIQSAINALTVGRTWKETVVLKGDLGYVHDITVPAYTTIEGSDAKLKLPSDKTYIFKGVSPAGDNVEFRNICFEAITTNRTVEPIGIDLGVPSNTQVANVKFENCEFLNFVYTSGTPSGIRGNYKGLTIFNCDFSFVSGVGNSYQIYLGGGEDIRVIGNRFFTNFAGNGLYAYQTKKIKVLANHFETGNLTAPVEAIDFESVVDAKVVGNDFYNISLSGVATGSQAVSGSSSDILIMANNFRSCGKVHTAKRGAVSINDPSGGTQPADRIEIIGNIAYDCDTGIVCSGEYGRIIANKIKVAFNWVEGGKYPIVLYGNNFNVCLIGNTFRNNTNPPYIEAGGTLYAKFNEGFVTENSGTATILSGNTSVTFAHGLAGTPTLVTLGATHAEVADAIWSADAINITITVPSAVSANRNISWSAEYKP